MGCVLPSAADARVPPGYGDLIKVPISFVAQFNEPICDCNIANENEHQVDTVVERGNDVPY